MANEQAKSRSEQLKAVSVEDINDTYKRGYLTALDRNKLLLEKAHQTVAGSLEEHGYLKAVLQQSIQHVQEGWDNLKESVVRQPTEGTVGEQIKGEAYYAGLAVWGQMQVVFSVMNAVGDVTGQVAENMALKAGASPGLARAINLGVNIGSSFVPVGGIAKSFAKTVQHAGKVGNVAKAAEHTAEAVAPQIDDAVKVVQTLAKGLETEGVVGAIKTLGKAAEDAGQPIAKALDAGADVVSMATKSVQAQFLEDLAIYRKKMDKITKVQSHEETAKMADAMGLSLDDLKNIVPGQALNEKEMYAYLKALEPQVTSLIEKAKTAVATNDPTDLENLARHASELFTVAPIFRGAEVTGGRAVEILKTTPPMKAITDLLTHWDHEAIAKGDFHGAMGTFAEDMAAMGEHPEKLTALATTSQSLWQRMGETAWPRMREAYINLLLARPLTQVRNFIGNSVAATNAVMDRYAAGLFGLGKEGGIQLNEGTYLAKGMAWSVRDGMKQFAEAYKTLDPNDISKLDYVPHQIPGLLGRIINSPGDTMRGMDNFFKTILRRGSYYAEAYRTAAERGYTAAETATYAAERVNNPTQAMLTHGEDFALYQTFQNELGTLGKAAQKALQAGPLVTWFPFMKTPINLAKYAWNRTPGLQLMASSLYDDILAGGARADLAIGKLTISQLQAHFLFNLAQEGIITGSGPIDPQLRGSWMAKNKPYSINGAYGDYPLTNMEPGTTTMGLMADYAQVMNQLDDPSAEQGAMAVTFAIMKNLVSKSYWQTVGDVVDITSSLTRGEPVGAKATHVLVNPLVTTLTGGPLGATTARIIDPIAREARDFMDQLTAKVPGYSSTLPPKRDGYGDPILPPQTIGGPWLSYLSPFTYAPDSTDPIKSEGEKLHAKLPTFPWNIGGNVQDDFDIREPQPGDKFGVGLTPKQRDRWQQIYKNILRHPDLGIDKQVIENPLYQAQMPALKRETFQGYLSDAKSTALDALLVEDPELQKSLLKQDTAAIRPLLQMQQQGTMDQRLREGTDLIDSLSREQQQNLLRWGILEPEEPAMSR